MKYICFTFFLTSLLLSSYFIFKSQGNLPARSVNIFGEQILGESIESQKFPRTGDLLLWSSTGLDSLAIQRMTDGPYSHCGVVFRDSEEKIWVLDVYPKEGLRYKSIQDYLNPKGEELMRVALLRYKGDLDIPLLAQRIHTLLDIRDRISFDVELKLDVSDMTLSDSKNSLSLYCGELIYLLYQGISSHPDIFENDYERVMKKWDDLIEKGRHQSAVNMLQIHYIKKYLNSLRNDSHKILYSPNGIIRRSRFEPIQEVNSTAKPVLFKKMMTKLEEGA